MKFLGGKPDALLDGLNVEISNSLTLQRRPGLSGYGPSIDPPRAFYPWEIATTGDIDLIVDTQKGNNSNNGQVLRYSPTNSGVYLNKAVGSGQTNFITVDDTLYLGDGVDLFKIVGPNLLLQSNTFNTGSGAGFVIQSPWTESGISAMTPRQIDPNGGTSATEIQWSTTGPSANLEQQVVPNYIPIANNTFTFSIWMKINGGSQTIEMRIADQSGSISSQTFTLITAWQKFQITGTMGSSSSQINIAILNASTTTATVIYGAQLEVGGPATTTQITTTRAQGVYLWGIQGPSGAPTLTYQNAAGSGPGFPPNWAPNTAYTANSSIIIDSNGDLELCTASGTSGTTQPTWAGYGGVTVDGVSNSIVQEASGFVASNSVTVALSNAVTLDNTLFAFISGDVPSSTPSFTITDTQSNVWTLVDHVNAGDNNIWIYSVLASAIAGATSVTATVTAPTCYGIYLCVAEIEGLTVQEVVNSNSGRNVSGSVFSTGVVTTTQSTAFIITFASAENNLGPQANILGSPNNYQILGSLNATASSRNRWFSIGASCIFLASIEAVNPTWSLSGSPATNGIAGITAAYSTATSTLQWTNVGKIYVLNGVTYNAGLTPTIGYTYYYAFMNSTTGHVSNVSLASVSTGASDVSTGTLIAQIVKVSGVGMQTVLSGGYGQDPQVDTIVVFRNTDGGAFFFQIATFANPGTSGSAGTWTLYDVAPDNGVEFTSQVLLNNISTPVVEQLNDEIYAPIGLLNTPPPAGLVDFDYFAGRMFGSDGSFVFYNTAADNASLLGITQNGVPAESWAPSNDIPFNASVTRIVAVGGGLFTCTVLDSWFVTGQSLTTGGFNADKILINHGLRSYNALSVDGSTIYMYTSDREFLCVNANSGSVEFGFPIGDLLEKTFSPISAYVVRHVAGSRDNCVFLSDGISKWIRLNPNQQGASMAGEQTPVWSPVADFSQTVGGIGALASIETSPGVIQLLVGGVTETPALYRNLDIFSDDGISYAWFATIGSILLATSGKLAETESITTEMNNNTGSTQCGVWVLLEEIEGQFEQLPNSVNDPPQLNPSISVLSERFYLSQGATPPICRHMQLMLTSGTVNGEQQSTMDEILGLTIRGCLVSEQI